MTLIHDLDPKIQMMYGACILEMNFLGQSFQELVLLLIERAIRRNWVMLYWLVDKYRMTQ